MEIVDEDLAWGWIPLGSQFCEKIGDIIALSGDVMLLDSLEFVLELAHLLAACCQERAFVGGLLHDLIND